MKTIKTLVYGTILVILFLVNPVRAANWVEYGTSPQGDVYSYNKSSVKMITTDVIQFWQRYDFAHAIKNIKSTTVLRQIDCQLNKSKVMSVIDYDVYGSVLHNNTDEDTDWQDIPPDTRLDGLRKILCE